MRVLWADFDIKEFKQNNFEKSVYKTFYNQKKNKNI